MGKLKMGEMSNNYLLVYIMLLPLICVYSLYGKDDVVYSSDLWKKENSFIKFEPIFIKVAFKNIGKKSVQIIHPYRGYSTFDMELTGISDNGKLIEPTKKEHYFTYKSNPNVQIPDMLIVPPGKTYYYYINLIEFFTISFPADYKLVMKYGDLKGTINPSYEFPQKTILKEIKFKIRTLSHKESALISHLSHKKYNKKTYFLKPREYIFTAGNIIVLHQDSDFYQYTYYWLGMGHENKNYHNLAYYCLKKQLELFPATPVTDETKFMLHKLEIDYGLPKENKVGINKQDDEKLKKEDRKAYLIKGLERFIGFLEQGQEKYKEYIEELNKREEINLDILKKVKSEICFKEYRKGQARERIEQIKKMELPKK